MFSDGMVGVCVCVWEGGGSGGGRGVVIVDMFSDLWYVRGARYEVYLSSIYRFTLFCGDLFSDSLV